MQGSRLHEGAGWTIPLVPPALAWTNPAAVPGTGWVDGAPVTALNFGKRLFTWNPDTNVVDELPLFVFVMRDAQGNLVAPSFRTVAGTGPVGSGGLVPPKAGTQPLYSSYWRLYTVEVPPTAAPFADAVLRDELAAAGLPAPPAIDPAVVAMFPGIVGRIAIHPACFDDPQQIDPQVGSCTYFDSQAAIERGIAPLGNPADRRDRHLPVRELPGREPDRAGALMRSRALAIMAVLLVAPARRCRPQAPAATTRPSTTATATRPAPEGGAAPAPLTVNGYIDVGFAKAQGNGTSFAPGDQTVPGGLRRRPVRARGQHARRRRVDRRGRPVRQRVPAALGRASAGTRRSC